MYLSFENILSLFFVTKFLFLYKIIKWLYLFTGDTVEQARFFFYLIRFKDMAKNLGLLLPA